MAILEVDKIIEIIQADEPDFIKEAKHRQLILNVHVNGRNVIEYLEKIEGYENEEQYKLRKKVVISNKFVINNILRPVDKVFTAKGGSKIYNAGSDAGERTLIDQLSDVDGGMSITTWIKKIQANKFYSDPSGIVFFEVSEDGERTIPTIKSIQSIRNFDVSGRSLEWLLFEPVRRKDSEGNEIEGEFFRFIDDAFDRTFVKIGEKVTELTDEQFPIRFSKLPAILNSDLPNDSLRYNDSPVDPIVELSNKYLRTNTIKSVHEFLHGFPFFWMYHKGCSNCNGTGEIRGEICKTCNGTGMGKIKRDVSDGLLLKPPKSADAPVIAPNVAGYVTPPLDIPEEQRTELGWLANLMHFTVWGTHQVEDGNNETATGRFLNVQPVNDRLGDFSDSFQDMEQKMTDFIGEFYIGERYEGSSINYGRRYLMESPDVIWTRYLTAKEKGAPKVALDELLGQFYHSEYANDPNMLTVVLKGMEVEPFVHSTITQAATFNLTDLQLKEKVFFNEWWKTLDPMEIIQSTTEVLKSRLTEFARSMDSPEPIPEPLEE